MPGNTPRYLTVAVDLIAVAAIVGLALGWAHAAADADAWAQRVYRVCQTYAGLDLAELAPLCVDAGYQGGAPADRLAPCRDPGGLASERVPARPTNSMHASRSPPPRPGHRPLNPPLAVGRRTNQTRSKSRAQFLKYI